MPRMPTIERRFVPPQSSFFLFGPRGTGKTTLLRQLYPDALRIDLLDPRSERELSARPERVIDLVGGAEPGRPVVIDEVQRVPEVLPVVHHLIEDRQVTFVLTGSSARKLRRAGHDLLGGRAVVRTLHPFLATELADRFALEPALQTGTIPLVVASDDPHDVLAAYAGLYVREEVRHEGLVRNVGDFARFLEVISFSHGSQLNVSNVAREAQVGRRTVSNFVGILVDLLLAFMLPPFTKRAARQVVLHPKFYFVDAGLFRSLRPKGPLDSPSEIGGAALEGLVVQMIRAHLAYQQRDTQMFFWRTRSGLEVDVVLYGPETLLAIEVKNSDRVRDADERGLRAFLDDYPEARAIVVYRGDRALERRGIRWVPAERFLLGLDSILQPRSVSPGER